MGRLCRGGVLGRKHAATILRAVGEFDVIARMLARLRAPSERVVLGPGDDAGVLDWKAEQVVATADLLVEGTHFDRGFSSLADIGYKAIAVNCSDLAAMGACPVAALVSLGVREQDEGPAVYDGIAEAAARFGVDILGGDTVRAERLIISVAALGEAPGPIVGRAGARAGDVLVVTGSLGGAAAALAAFRAGVPIDEEGARRHRRPTARVEEGIALARAGAHAMIDVSDGLVADVGHICSASGVGVEVDVEALRTLAPQGPDGLSFALSGGDDYELLAAIGSDAVPAGATVIGRFDAVPGVRRSDGEQIVLAGWDHFA